MSFHSSFRTISYNEGILTLIDQRKLPTEESYVELSDVESVAQSIENMIHQGAKEFLEIGPGNVLQGLVKKISRDTLTGKPSV